MKKNTSITFRLLFDGTPSLPAVVMVLSFVDFYRYAGHRLGGAAQRRSITMSDSGPSAGTITTGLAVVPTWRISSSSVLATTEPWVV